MARRAPSAVAEDTGTPLMAMRPEVGRINPASIRMVVVLPAPLGPSSVTISPALTASDRSLTATRDSNVRVRRSAIEQRSRHPASD